MDLRILTQPEDMDAVRTMALGMLPPAVAAARIPDQTIQSPSVGMRAEQLVIRRIGPDWAAILAGAAPAQYAGGDVVSAKMLLIDAAIMYACAQLCPILRQLVATQEKSEMVSTTLDIDWTEQRKDYERQAREALNMLAPVGPLPTMETSGPTRWPVPISDEELARLRQVVQGLGL